MDASSRNEGTLAHSMDTSRNEGTLAHSMDASSRNEGMLTHSFIILDFHLSIVFWKECQNN